MTGQAPWGEIVEWPGFSGRKLAAGLREPVVLPEAPAVDPDGPALAMPLLRAWWHWDRWGRAHSEPGHFPSRMDGERVTAAFEDALLAFAEWAGVSSTSLRERLAELGRMAGPPPLIGFDIRQPVKLVPKVMREQLSAIVGHS